MSKLSKPPLRVAQEALAIGARALRRYAHKYSPKKFTQPQLFACLVLKTLLREAAVDGASHLIVGAIPRRGPAVDTDRFVPLLENVLRRVKLVTALADAGFDAAPTHR